MLINEHIESLRSLMKKEGMDAYLIDNSDHHSSEYVNDYYKERTFMTGFDGSNGKALVTLDEAFLWTDGRYFLQAEIDLKDTEIKLMKMSIEGYPSLLEYIEKNLSGKVIGFDGECFSSSLIKEISKYLIVKGDKDLVNEVWKERGNLQFKEIWSLSNSLSGESTVAKIKRVRNVLKEKGATSHILTSLDDIAWLFNLRGNDVSITPVFLSYAYISLKQAILFVNTSSLNEETIKALNDAKIEIRGYDEFLSFIKTLRNEDILVSSSSLNYSYLEALSNSSNTIIDSENPEVIMKAIKNKVQIKNDKDIHIADGLAVFRFMKYLKENYGKVPLSEWPLSQKALEYRMKDSRFFEVSFESIASWNKNGAIIHYEPTKDHYTMIEGSGFFLLDSGGQYMGGTTDITRTYSLGEISETMKHHYTLVLRAFIDVSMAKFKKGCTGRNIDMLAREPFFSEGLDFLHGTGHGVGYMLNVHEGPQGLRYNSVVERNDSAIFTPGMITSIEPGLYLKDQYGIRIEDEILCVADETTEWGEFYRFETLTCAPIDLEPILVKELSKKEKKWLNDYHQFVYRKLSKICDESELEYLRYVTRRI